MSRLLYSRKNANDRFIPRRLNANPNLNTSLEDDFCDEVDLADGDFINFAKIRHNRDKYRASLREAMFPFETKVLNFFPPKKISEKDTFAGFGVWPIKPVKRPYIGAPNIILDMPQFDARIGHHVADWSSKNCLATIFEHEIHMWCPESEELRAITATHNRADICVKWKKDGTQFAMGLFPTKFGVFDILANKLVCESFCCATFCKIHVFEWTRSYLLTGCSKGFLKLFNSELSCISVSKKLHRSAIINIQCSSDEQFVATSGLDKMVNIIMIPHFTVSYCLRFETPTRALTWHPWKCALLAVGLGFKEGCVVLYNIKTRKQVAIERTTYENCSVDSLTFNPISGELVAGYSLCCGRLKRIGILAVLSDIDNVVEELHFHRGAIPYLLWGKGGNLLASISADESLCIWSFLDSVSEHKIKKRNTKHSLLFGNMIR